MVPWGHAVLIVLVCGRVAAFEWVEGEVGVLLQQSQRQRVMKASGWWSWMMNPMLNRAEGGLSNSIPGTTLTQAVSPAGFSTLFISIPPCGQLNSLALVSSWEPTI